MTISPPESGEKNKKVLEEPVKADPRPIDFAKLDKPGFWSSKLSKGPKTTTWIWNLHAVKHLLLSHMIKESFAYYFW